MCETDNDVRKEGDDIVRGIVYTKRKDISKRKRTILLFSLNFKPGYARISDT
jgi:hypothetical protein